MQMHRKLTFIKSILNLRPTEGSTFQQIKDDYDELVGEDIDCSYREFASMMMNVEDVKTFRDFYGNIYWISSSKKSEHMRHLIRHQKTKDPRKRNLPSASIQPCNFRQKARKMASSTSSNHRFEPYKKSVRKVSGPRTNYRAMFHNQDLCTPHLYDYHLIGDDFMLAVARIDLGFHLRQGCKIQQSGLCISGQTVSDAIIRLSQMPLEAIPKRVIISLGSVDLIHGRQALDIQTEYVYLLKMLSDLGVKVIVTTVAPIANFTIASNLKKNWEKLNVFLRGQPFFIDISEQVMQNKHILYSCYQGEAKYVTGSTRPHVLWNTIGRQRILKAMKAYLGDIL
ncbi:hypothetical protein DMENIID0001_066400 [Sergentomyia squamirostris]